MSAPHLPSFGGFVFIFILMPPIMTVLWWLMSRASNRAIFRVMTGDDLPERVKRRQRREFKWVLISLYVIGFGILVYAYLQ